MSKKPPQGFNALAESLKLVLKFRWLENGWHSQGIRWLPRRVNGNGSGVSPTSRDITRRNKRLMNLSRMRKVDVGCQRDE